MYDPDTSALIRQTPDLPNLDREELPDRLSRAFAEIASARVVMRDGDPTPARLAETLEFARRLARTNEALVVISPDREDRAAAAFVAATSHQLVRQVEAIGSDPSEPALLSADGISSDISAMLLFLAAEASADAAEVSQFIKLPQENPLQANLISALINLARGQVSAIVEAPLPRKGEVLIGSDPEKAVAALFYRILCGVRALAFRLQGQQIEDMADPIALFDNVKTIAAQRGGDDEADLPGNSTLAFPGPFHLASLLSLMGRTVMDGAVVNLPAPPGIDALRWRSAIERVGKNRPYLWRNHRSAVEKGYLTPGTSAVIGFPTGAGKSTVSQLKIHTALLTDRKAVFLAPTNALVDQTTNDLSKAFPSAKVRGQREDEFSDEDLPDILVMTPEACLSAIYQDPEAFEDVGLLIFDECHLLHPREDGNKRSIDAMLCILNVARVAPSADFVLLSAMMQNTAELAGWISDLTGRTTLPLDDSWKPTRQLRGCIVYDLDRIRNLEAKLRSRRKANTRVPSALKKTLSAVPYGFFSVQQTWASKKRDRYALVPIHRANLPFATNLQWQLTPNAGEVSATIAASAAETGIRVLVFATTIPGAASIAKKASAALGPCDIELTDFEHQLLNTAIDEIGDANHLYLPLRDGRLVGRASCHHGQLLPEERQLVEKLYRRNGAVSVLAATSTLAQGMNLPAELVILASDSEFKPDTGRQTILKAEDLLNAAGRAGRAGENATGMVLVVPSKVTGIDDEKSLIGQQWAKLREIFSQVDQCLVIDDPLTAVMDRIHDTSEEPNDLDRYVVARLVSASPDEEDTLKITSSLERSFGAYRKRQAGEADWVASRTEAAKRLLDDSSDGNTEDNPARDLAARFGFPEEVLRRLAGDIQSNPPLPDSSLVDWCSWVFAWLASHPDDVFRLLRPEGFEYLLGSKYKKLESNADRTAFALPLIAKGLKQWMAGDQLVEIQSTFSSETRDIKYSTSARKFVIRFIPDLAHLMGCITAIAETCALEDNGIEISAACQFLSSGVRRGYKCAEMAVFYSYFSRGGGRLARREVHRRFAEIAHHLSPPPTGESVDAMNSRVEAAIEAATNAR